MKKKLITRKEKLVFTIEQLETRLKEMRIEVVRERRRLRKEARLLDAQDWYLDTLRDYKVACETLNKAAEVICHHVKILNCASDEAIIKGTADLRSRFKVNQVGFDMPIRHDPNEPRYK